MTEDFYSVLGVDRDASEDEIKRAYRKKAAEFHPDVSDEPDAEEKFKQVKKAKEVLTDEEKRSAYDQMGHERFEQTEKRGGFDEGAGRARGGPFGGGGGDPFGGGGLGDIFEQFFGGGGGRGRGRGQRGPQGGQDLRTTLRIDLADAYEGVEKQVTLRRPERCDTCDGRGAAPGTDVSTCPECNGRGQVTRVQQTPLGRVQQTTTCRRCGGEGETYEEACPECGGDGEVTREASLQVEVPAGIADGQTLRMEGEGAPGDRGAPNGDLLIDVAVRDHPEIDREGQDLYRDLELSFPQAVFGDSVTVETLAGESELEIPAGTQSGETFRMAGKGMPRLRRRGHGKMYVTIQLQTPEPGDLDREQREALESFVEAGGDELDVDQSFFERIKNSL